LFRCSWVANEGETMQIAYRLEPHLGGTHFRFEQTGFTGIGGFFLAKLVMTPVRKKMFGDRLRVVLDELDREGNLRPAGPQPQLRQAMNKAPPPCCRSSGENHP